MNEKLISIKFCGGCNSRIDRRRIAAEVSVCLAMAGHVISFNRPEADVVIYLSGCTANCAEPVNQVMVHVVVAGTTVDRILREERQLVGEIINKVCGFLR